MIEITQAHIDEFSFIIKTESAQLLLNKLLIEFDYTEEQGNPLVFILSNIWATYNVLKERIKRIDAISDIDQEILDLKELKRQIENWEIDINEEE